jgi:hypothetical protein
VPEPQCDGAPVANLMLNINIIVKMAPVPNEKNYFLRGINILAVYRYRFICTVVGKEGDPGKIFCQEPYRI